MNLILRAAGLAIVTLLFGLLPALAQSAPQANSVWVVPIETEINGATAQYIASRIERANEERPLALVFMIDTPGGQVRAMERIVDSILTRAQVPTMAVVRNAFSAGALIAMSAEQVAMLPGSAIGAAMPVALSPTGVSPVDAKTTSALRGSFRSVAEARGRNSLLAEAMVDANIDVPGLAVAGELLTLSANQAVENDIADISAATLLDALDQFGYGGALVSLMEPNLTERMAGWLSSPIAIGLLLVIGIGGLLIEFFTPGFGIPGALGVVALGLLGLTTIIATPAGTIDVVLLIAGLILIMVEVFVAPGTIIAAVLGVAAIVTALVRIFQNDAIAVLGWSTLFAGVALAALLWLFPRTRFASRFMLETRLAGGDGATVSLTPESSKRELLGKTGIALSDLRPAGVARIDGERIDVVTQGDFIPVNSPVEVRMVEGNRVIVRLLEAEAGASSDTPTS